LVYLAGLFFGLDPSDPSSRRDRDRLNGIDPMIRLAPLKAGIGRIAAAAGSTLTRIVGLRIAPGIDQIIATTG
jgi:hypothetical protein